MFAGVPASLSAFAVAFAGVPASLSAFAVAFAGVPQVSRHLPWGVCGHRRIWPGASADAGVSPWGFCRPGFRPGLWSTGPTARPGTGERPVGAPDHSQGRNPWCVDDRGETPGGGPGTRCGRIRAGRVRAFAPSGGRCIRAAQGFALGYGPPGLQPGRVRAFGSLRVPGQIRRRP